MIHGIKSSFFVIVLVSLLMQDIIVCLPFGGTWRQVGLDIDGTGLFDRFGYSVAMSADGKTIVVGAPGNSNINGSSAGQVQVYSINSTINDWQQLGSNINGKATNNFFGESVCISADGKMIAAGATGNDNANGTNSGHVRVFSYNSVIRQWVQVGLDIIGEGGGDQSGESVVMSADGKTIAIGAASNNNAIGAASGHVRVYSINGMSGNWTQIGMDIDGETTNDYSGFVVAMSADGKTIAIGAPFNNAITGHVRVFSFNSTSRNWKQIGSDLNGEAVRDQFGFSVAMSADGKTVAIGANKNDNINGKDSGHVRVYTMNGTVGDWGQVGSDIDGVALDDESGFSVAMSADGQTIAIGAPYNNNINGVDSGQVRVFSFNASSRNWTQTGEDIIGESGASLSGNSVAISNNGYTLTIGAQANQNKNNIGSGHVRVYKYEAPPTKAPTRMPTRRPTKNPTKTPTTSPTKFPTKNPTKSPTKNPTKRPTKAPSKSPTKVPTKAQSTLPTKAPTKRPTTDPTNVPLQVTQPVPIAMPIQQAPLEVPVTASTNCGLFGLNLFCPRRGECGFWRRLLNLNGC